jgi:hypothetical protein
MMGQIKSDHEIIVYAADALLIADGLGQIVGAALLAYGLASPADVLVRDQAKLPRIFPMPLVFVKGGGGVGLIGVF